MADKREQVMLKVGSVLRTMAGIKAVYRDKGEVPAKDETTGELNTPFCILLDGGERRSPKTRDAKGTTLMGLHQPVLMDLMPQIFLVVTPRAPADAELIGPDLSTWIQTVIKTLLSDESLISLLGANGEIQYRGHDTDMQTGSTLEGSVQFDFVFTYVLNPATL